MRALLIDDSSTMKKIQRNILSDIDISSEQASNGKEALDILENDHNFDIILLDINMPKMDGLATLKELKENDDYKAIPVLMCSSVAEKDKVTEAIKNGASNYIVKPFQPDSLINKVEKLIDRDAGMSPTLLKKLQENGFDDL
ncbi:MAG: response regulator [Lentisphaeraceae bacterium]|nr:response regulator [Lentisphaeraceae bacterium]